MSPIPHPSLLISIPSSHFRAVPLRAGDRDLHPGQLLAEVPPLPLHRVGLPRRHRHHVGLAHLRHRRQGHGRDRDGRPRSGRRQCNGKCGEEFFLRDI